MIPNNHVSRIDAEQKWAYVTRKEASFLEDWERGGLNINDPSGGLDKYNWRAWVKGDDVYIGRDGVPEKKVFTHKAISQLAFAFDRNMHPNIAIQSLGRVLLYWYNPDINDHVLTDFGEGTFPRMTLDDHRDGRSNTSDIIFAYQRSRALYMCVQRERYGIQHKLADNPIGELDAIGMTNKWRFCFKFRDIESRTIYEDHKIELEYSNDGGYNWSNKRERSVGMIGEYEHRVKFNRLGSFRNRVFRISTSSPIDLELLGGVANIKATNE